MQTCVISYTHALTARKPYKKCELIWLAQIGRHLKCSAEEAIYKSIVTKLK